MFHPIQYVVEEQLSMLPEVRRQSEKYSANYPSCKSLLAVPSPLDTQDHVMAPLLIEIFYVGIRGDGNFRLHRADRVGAR